MGQKFLSLDKHQQRGFTLLEVLVALAVLAIGLGAIVKVATESASNTRYLRDRTLASWVASNKINELLLSRQWPALGEQKGESIMAGRPWRWQLRVSNTSDAHLRRLDIAVSAANNEDSLVELVAFKGQFQ